MILPNNQYFVSVFSLTSFQKGIRCFFNPRDFLCSSSEVVKPYVHDKAYYNNKNYS